VQGFTVLIHSFTTGPLICITSDFGSPNCMRLVLKVPNFGISKAILSIPMNTPKLEVTHAMEKIGA